MTIKRYGGVFGRNPTFNNVTVENDLTIDGQLIIGGNVITGLSYQGAWNASTNTPSLTTATPSVGQFWIVSVAGNTNLGGITSWSQGDWALYDGAAWQRVEGGTVDLTNGVTGILPMANGGTGAPDAATARQNLDLEIGVDVQAYDADTAKYDDATANFTGTLQNGGSNVLVDTDIGSTVQGYDADTAKYDDATANFTGTLQNGGSNVVVDTDIGSTVQGYDADTAKYDDTTANFTGTLQNGGSNVLVDTDIGSTVQGYDADTAKYDDTTANFTGTLQNGGSNVVVDTDIGSTVQAYDAGLNSIAGLTTAADKMIYTTAADTYAVTDLTSAGRAILDDADASAQRTTLGLGTMATQAANNVAITGGTINGTTIGATTKTTARVTSIGIGSAATDSITVSGTNPGGTSYNTVFQGPSAGQNDVVSWELKRSSGGAYGEWKIINGNDSSIYFFLPLGSLAGNGELNPASTQLSIKATTFPQADNTYSMGKSGYKWSEIWSNSGSINTSDARKKTDVQDSDLGLSFINALRPVSYKWIVGQNVTSIDQETGEVTVTAQPGKRRHYGLISQEVKAVLAEKDFAGYIHDQEQDEYGLRYEQFIAPLIKAVQELSSRVIELETKLASVKS